jgi:hypothetical protein
MRSSTVVCINEQNNDVRPVNKVTVPYNRIETKINYMKFVEKESVGLIFQKEYWPAVRHITG